MEDKFASEKNKRTVSFIPRYSIYSTKKNISFNMLENFDFSSIKNIISIKFISPLTTTISHILAKVKENKIKINTKKSNLSVTLNAKTNNNFVNLISKSKLLTHIFFSSKNTFVLFKGTGNIVSKLFAKTNTVINIKSIANEKLIFLLKSIVSEKIINSVNALIKINFSPLNSKLKINNNAPIVSEKLFAKTTDDSGIFFENSTSTELILFASTYQNKVLYKNIASAVVYRPNKIGVFYNNTLEEMYDMKMSELYGVELL